MKITRNLNGAELSVAVQGEPDTLTAPQPEEELRNGLSALTAISFDFEGLKVSPPPGSGCCSSRFAA